MTQVSPQGGGREPNKPTPEDVKLLPEGSAVLSPEIVAFLMGEAAYDGVWFGELNKGQRGKFWWRAIIRTAQRETAARTPASTSEAGGAGWRLVPVELSEADIAAWRQLVIPSRSLSPQANWTRMLSALSAAPTPSTSEASEQLKALRIGDKVLVNADRLPMSYRDYWRDVEAYIVALSHDEAMPGGIDVAISERWPPERKSDRTDGFNPTDLIFLSHAEEGGK